MNLLGIDVGSSSVKAGLLRDGRLVRRVAREPFATRYDGVRADVDPAALLRAVARAVKSLAARSVDVVGLSVMSPAWVAMDRRGCAITPIVTHQDRRSVEVAHDLERRVGKARHLRLAGNRPFPGGVSSTTCAWFLRNHPALMRRADLVGHLDTFLHRQLTASRVTDPSNASYTGLYRTTTLAGWSDELCDAVGMTMHALPQVLWADEIGGLLTRSGGRLLGLSHGTPLLTGIADTSAAMLFAGARPGQLLNSCGSTDVLALCTQRPRPDERLMTRALGVDRKWLSVSTLAAAGSAIEWVRNQLFADHSWPRFRELLRRLGRRGAAPSGLRFEPYLAGDRTSMAQRTAAFEGMTLAMTRHDMLAAVCDALAQAGARRLELLALNPVPMRRRVVVTGGVPTQISALLRRDWKGMWTFRREEQATLRGLAMLVPRGRSSRAAESCAG